VSFRSKVTKKYKTGFIVSAYGESWWHRTEKGADKRAASAQNYCHNVQITDVKTDKLVGGKPG